MRNRETIARIVMVALLLYALAHFAAARMTLRRTEELADSLQTQYEALREENAVLQARLAAGADIETKKRWRVSVWVWSCPERSYFTL